MEIPDLTKAIEAVEELGDELRKIVCSYCGLLHEPGDCVYAEGKSSPHVGSYGKLKDAP